jgi:tetratricopeptide (TPR) repeat protein
MVMPVDPAFGSALRRARLAAGVSLAALARKVNYSKGYLSKIENGSSAPTAPLARRCDVELGAGGALAALVPGRATARVAPAPGVESGGGWQLGFGPAGSWFLPESPDSPPASAFPLSRVSAASGGFGAELEAAFGVMFQHLRALGRTAAPGVVLPLVISQVGVLREQVPVASEPARARLLTLTARCAEYAGWMAQEAGDDRAAQFWTGQAGQLAEAAGDRDLAGYALVRQAELALYRDDPLRTVDLAVRAGELPGVSSRTRALAAHRAAQGYARAGDGPRCAVALDRAAELLAGPDGIPLGATTVGDLGAAIAGWCAYDLGRTTRAIEDLEAGLRGIPVDSLRIRAVFAARLALAHEAAGNLDEVDRLAREILAVVPRIGSASVRSQLRILSRALVRGSHRPVARDLHAALADALHDR